MLKIEIFPEDVKVATRTTKPKDDKPGRDIYEQDAYAYIGGKFPVQMKLQLEKDNNLTRPDSIHHTAQAMRLIILAPLN